MAAYIPVLDTVMVEWIMSQSGQIIENIAHFKFPSTPDTLDLTELAGRALTGWITSMAPVLTNALDLNQIKVTDLTTASSPVFIQSAPSDTDGDLNVQSNPLNVALVISERTASRGRSYRGRWYQASSPMSANVDSGSISGTYQTDLLAAFIDMIELCENVSTCVHSVVSRYTNNAPRVTGVATPITGYALNVDFDSRRSRLKGRGA